MLPARAFCATRDAFWEFSNIGCLKINETHKISDKYVDFNPILLYFSDLIAVINNNYYFKTLWLEN